MTDYIPSSDGDFELWRSAFDAYLKSVMASLGLAPADVAVLDTRQTAWQNALSEYLSQKSALEAALAAKNTAREQLEDIIRPFVKQLQTNPAMTDKDRAGLGITVPDSTRTRVPAPSTNPIGQVDTSTPLQHTIHFRDSQTPNSTAKPEGYRGCQIWFFIGTQPPTDLDQYAFVATDTRTPYVLHFDMADAGKTAYYRLRWVNTRDEPGPWSETLSATITG